MKKNQKIIITKSGIELKQTEDIKSHELYKENKTKAILEIYNHINNNNNEQITFIKEIIEYYYTQLSQCLDNTIIDIKFDQEIKNNIINNTPFIKGEEYVNEHWLDKITTTFNEYINELHIKNIETYLKDQQYNYQKKGRIFFHLVESKKEDLPFAFLATYSKIIDCKTKHMPLKSALTIYKEDNRELLNILTCVKKVSVQSDFIKQLLNDGSIYKPFFLNKIDAYTFLKEVPLYEQSGITCRIPNFFKKKNKSIKTSLKIETSPSYLNLNNLLNVEVILKIDDLTLTKKEVTEILNQTGLAFIKGKWIEIDKKKLKEVLIKYEKLEEIYNDKQITMKEALLLNAKTDINITNGEKFNEILENIIKKTNFEQIIMPSTFKANLRPYQQIGVNYLTYMQKLGLGVCLADDMGLGKTIQILGFLATQNNHNITLIVMPSSLIGNWEKEIKTFIPSKKVLILHNNYAKPDKQQIKNNDIIITSYGMVTKLDFLKEIKFDILILDEAQAIKNANAIKSISINNLKANYKIALTGTPIENSLSDLWSIFNFLNPYLLGDINQFSRYVKQLKQNSNFNQLKKQIEPFMLRRLKSDQTIITDLTTKTERYEYIILTEKQKTLYQAYADDMIKKIPVIKPKEKSSLILTAIVKFKQICNHPDQYLGLEEYKMSDSGKFIALNSIIKDIQKKNEKVLIFTQFTEIIPHLQKFLEQLYQHKGLVISGKTTSKQRSLIAFEFQNNDNISFMILSLKAGGTGLNLTKACHVIHFDRWWNAAVENQATDRVFRIGQTKNVTIHKFLTKGTIEEKINDLIKSKEKLTEDVITSGNSNVLNKLTKEELIELFKYSYRE